MDDDRQEYTVATTGVIVTVAIVLLWLLLAPTIAGAAISPQLGAARTYLPIVHTTDDWCIVQHNGNDDDLRPCTDIERKILTEDPDWCLFEDHSVGRCRPDRYFEPLIVGARP